MYIPNDTAAGLSNYTDQQSDTAQSIKTITVCAFIPLSLRE